MASEFLESVGGAIAGQLIGGKLKDIFGIGIGKETKPEADKKHVEDKPSETSNSIFNWLRENKETKDKAEAIREKAQEERKGIFGSVWDSILVRYFPTISALKDLKNPIKIYESIKENPLNIISEMDGILADTLFISFISDSWLKYVTDPIVHTDIFKKIVEMYDKGLGGVLTPDVPILNHIPIVGPEKQNWFEKIYGSEHYNPRDVIDFMRIVLKDKDVLKAVIQKVA